MRSLESRVAALEAIVNTASLRVLMPQCADDGTLSVTDGRKRLVQRSDETIEELAARARREFGSGCVVGVVGDDRL